jgi:hypothetical protein
VKRRAALAKKEIELVPVLCKGAFDALMNGDATTHDKLVSDALTALSSKVDAIVLAQASMERVVASLPAEREQVPIFSSPVAAMQFLAAVLQ